MTLEEIRALKPGDRVELTYVVEVVRVDHEDNSMPILAKTDGGRGTDWMQAATFANAKVLPAPLKVGDRVTWGNGEAAYAIVHIDEDRQQAALHDAQWGFKTQPLDNLRRADA